VKVEATANRASLTAALRLASTVLDGRDLGGVMNCACFTLASWGGLLTATDGVQSVTCKVDGAGEGELLLPVARAMNFLSASKAETVAISGDGIDELKKRLADAAVPSVSALYDKNLLKTIEQLERHFPESVPARRALSVSLYAKDKSAWAHAAKVLTPGFLGQLETDVEAAAKKFVRGPDVLLFEAKQHKVQEIIGQVQTIQKSGGKTFLSRLGNWTMRPWPGYLVALLTLFAMYEFVGVFGAGTLVGFLENTFFGAWLNPLATRIVDAVFPWTLVREFLVGPYGTITMALTYALALILPIVTTFFLFFGFLEDSGYLPRLAVMMDRLFRLMGLNGRAVLPMVLGLGCDTMATVTTRILDTKKEKIIVSLLLTLTVPCSAQLAAILGMSAGVSGRVLLLWLGVISAVTMLVGWGASRVLPGARSPFLVEIPPLRVPKASNIFKKVRARLKWYTKEVIPLFVLATGVLFFMDKFHLLRYLENIFSPVVVGVLGLPVQATEAFIVGFFRRDYGAAGFFHLAKDGLLNPTQVAVSMVVITLFMPCVAHVLITLKERGAKATVGIMAFVLSFSIGVGGLLNWMLLKWPFILNG
jgi:ferrous iron transport protein B